MDTARLSEQATNISADAVAAKCDGGYLAIYDGIQPASPDERPHGRVLVQISFESRAFRRAVRGEAVCKPFPTVRAVASGTAKYFRAFSSKGKPVLDGDVGTFGAVMILRATQIEEDDLIEIEELTFRQAAERPGVN